MQRLLNGEELRAALANGKLSSSTLVWKRGMKSWLPAAAVPELAVDPATITVTKGKAYGQRPVGEKAPPSASIPAPGLMAEALFDEDTGTHPRPANLVDIASLRKAQSTRRGSKPAEEEKPVAKAKAARPLGVSSIPKAPRLPDIPLPGGSKKPRPDMNGERIWAAPDHEEPTVTRVRNDDEVATAKGQPAAYIRKNSAAPTAVSPSKRPPPPPRSRRPISKRGARTMVSQDESEEQTVAKPVPKSVAKTLARRDAARRQRETQAAGTLASEEASIAKLASFAAGATLNSVREGEQSALQQESKKIEVHMSVARDRSDPPPAVERVQAVNKTAVMPEQRRSVQPTGPLPEVRPAVPSLRPEPNFSQEPWQRDDEPVGAPPPASRRGLSGLVLRKPVLGGIAGAVAALLIASFFVGRLSSPARSNVVAAVQAQTGWEAVPLFARAKTMPPAPQRPCLMTRAPARWADEASRKIPFQMQATSKGELAIGYARSINQAAGLAAIPSSGQIVSRYEPAEGEDDLSRIVPIEAGGELRYDVTFADAGGIFGATAVASPQPIVVGFRDGELVTQTSDGAPHTAWTMPGAARRPDALTALHVAAAGIAVAYRHDGQVYFGWLDEAGKALKEAAVVPGSGGKVGKPVLAFQDKELSLVFADKPPDEGSVVEIRWGRALRGEMIQEATPLTLPVGGPGGDAIAPAVAGLTGGRWILMWTEGRSGQRTLRAQTYDRKGEALGEALRVSPATGSFGQGTVGVVGESAAVVFLLASQRRYEVWGTVLQCR